MSSRWRGARRAWFFGLLAALPGVAAAAPPDSAPALHFARVGIEGGPPPEVVTALYQDRTGFVWIGSRDGLFRYDGADFLEFKHVPGDPGSISDNIIRVLFEDRRGLLWIGTNSGGLDRLDRARRAFTHYRHDSADPASLSHDSVYAVAEDPAGALWVATQHGLNRFAADSRACQRFLADPADPGSLGGDYVTALLVDHAGRLWAGTNGGGLSVREPGSEAFHTYRHDPADPASLPSDHVFALLEPAAGEIWIGTQEGLARWNEAGQRFDRYRHDAGDAAGAGNAGDAAAATEPLVTALAHDPAGQVWIGTWGAGLHALEPETRRFHVSRHDPLHPDGLGSDRIVSVLADRAGGLWVGTWGNGLQRLAPSARLLAERVDRARSPGDDGNVGALLADRDGALWIGTLSGRLVRRAADGSAERLFPEATGGTSIQILSLLQDRRGRIWVGSSVALRCLDPATGRSQAFKHDAADPGSLGPGYVRTLFEDRQGRLWVGTGEGGLQRLGDDGRVAARYVHDPTDPRTLSDDYVVAIAEDRRGTLWVGTRSGGLNALDPGTGVVARFLPEARDPRSLGHHSVTDLLEDGAGRVWVGTGGGGLHRIDLDVAGTVSFQRFTEADGLVNDDIVALLPDDDGSLWVSTRRGLSRLDPDAGRVANYRVSDGLPTGEFEVGAAARVGDTLFFGGARGLVALPAGTPFAVAHPAPTLLSSIHTAAGEIHGNVPVWEMDGLEIPYGEWLRLEFMVLDFGPGDRHRYSYRLGAADAPWIELGPQRGVTFTDLKPGVQRFTARGRSDDGQWTEAATPLVIRVIPPFWMTLWFRLASLGALAALALGAHRFRTAALERRNRELVALQRQRESVQAALSRAYDRLRLLTRRLEAAREDERRNIARELHDELGPALTAVAINLQLLTQGADAPRHARRLADSTELVDRMAQQIRDLSLGLRPPLLDEMGLVAALKGYLETEAERTGLVIDVRGDAVVEGLPPDIEISAFRLIQEAVTNVLRHARARRVIVSVERGEDRLDLVVQDDGAGFDAAAALDEAATGKALGLLGMQERVQILGGTFELRSTPGEGTRVSASLPLGAGR